MKYCSMLAMILTGLFVSAASAQNAPSMAEVVKQNYNQMKNLLTKAADAMPESDYDFKPTPQERSFGSWVGHVADAQMRTCSGIAGAAKNLNAESKTSKADLVAALKESFDACDPVFEGLTDANASSPVPGFRGPQPRLTSQFGMLSHDNECYGSMAVYLRLKGIVPPSTAAMGRRGGMRRGGKKD